MPFAAIVQRIRSFSLSIGQLTFGSFLLVLAVIMMTSIQRRRHPSYHTTFTNCSGCKASAIWPVRSTGA